MAELACGWNHSRCYCQRDIWNSTRRLFSRLVVDGRALDGITVGDFVRAIEGTVLVGTFVGLVNGRALLDGRTDGALVGVMVPEKKQVVDGLNVIGRLEEVVGEEDG